MGSLLPQVLVRAVDGNNEGFYFHGMGSAQTDDVDGDYGGVVFAYDATSVRLWAPDVYQSKFTTGYIVSIPSGWGTTNTQTTLDAQVKVLAWETCTSC